MSSVRKGAGGGRGRGGMWEEKIHNLIVVGWGVFAG